MKLVDAKARKEKLSQWHTRFAFRPWRCDDGSIVWLERYWRRAELWSDGDFRDWKYQTKEHRAQEEADRIEEAAKRKEEVLAAFKHDEEIHTSGIKLTGVGVSFAGPPVYSGTMPTVSEYHTKSPSVIVKTDILKMMEDIKELQRRMGYSEPAPPLPIFGSRKDIEAAEEERNVLPNEIEVEDKW